MSNEISMNANQEVSDVSEAQEVLTDEAVATDVDYDFSDEPEDSVVDTVEAEDEAATTAVSTDTATDEAADTNDDFIPASVMEAPEAKQGALSSFVELSAFSPLTNIVGGRRGNNRNVPTVTVRKAGYRIELSHTLFDLLEQPKHLAIALTDTQLALGKELPMPAQKYAFSPADDTHIIYGKVMVDAIIKHFGLEFVGTGSLPFTDVRMDSFVNASGISIPVAIVTLK